jgi:hypothetical protein
LENDRRKNSKTVPRSFTKAIDNSYSEGRTGQKGNTRTSGKSLSQRCSAFRSSKTQSKGREQEASDQEDEERYEYALTAVISHIGVKIDSTDYMAFCKIEERWWRFDGTDCTQVDDMKVFSVNFPENDFVQPAALLIYARTTDEHEIEQ